MERDRNKKRRPAYLWFLGCLVLAAMFSACGREEVPASTEPVREETGKTWTLDEHAQVLDDLKAGESILSAEELFDFAMDVSLVYEAETKKLRFSLDMPLIPASDDAYLYLFAAEEWEEDAEALRQEPVTRARKARAWETAFPYRETYLFSRFIPALKIDENFVQLGKSIYLSNPEALAGNQDAYPELASKKGLLLDPTMLGTPELTDLGVKHTIYNIPLSHIMGSCVAKLISKSSW